MPRSLVWVALAIAGVAGCDAKPQDPPPDLVKSQRQAMDRAKGVEEALQKSADERRQQADRQK
jgi:hypothetical protein